MPKHKSGFLDNYDRQSAFCELTGNGSEDRLPQVHFWQHLEQLTLASLRSRALDAQKELLERGITFTVYSDRDAIDRALPFDVVPRVITASEWKHLERGIAQRVQALNIFLNDIYSEQKCLKDEILPAELVLANANFLKQMVGIKLPQNTYIHIAGVDLIRDHAGQFCVLEDNVRSPSGVSYVVENRQLMQRAFPDLFEGIDVEDVSIYGQVLRQKLTETAPDPTNDARIVLLSPGVFNSAYYEHIFLAREMGVQLVEGGDLAVHDKRVYLKTVAGPEPVDVIYRRIDDAFLDPLEFNPESLLGVPGLIDCLRAGTVTIANAPGTGIADDKAVYCYVPDLIRYYLDEEPILPNVETYMCRDPDQLKYVLENLDKLVVKPVGESGGYGIVVGPKSTRQEIEDCRVKLLKEPEKFIAQPMIELSVCPTVTDDGMAARHVDLRPFAISGKDTWVLPGGLTRVALREGSIIVNSSQGGGTKDTWVLSSD